MIDRAGRLVAMSAIVGTLLYWPVGLALVLLCKAIGVPAESLLTFGGVLGIFVGMLVWWLMAFLIALPYSAAVFPWDAKLDGFRASLSTAATRRPAREDETWPKKT